MQLLSLVIVACSSDKSHSAQDIQAQRDIDTQSEAHAALDDHPMSSRSSHKIAAAVLQNGRARSACNAFTSLGVGELNARMPPANPLAALQVLTNAQKDRAHRSRTSPSRTI